MIANLLSGKSTGEFYVKIRPGQCLGPSSGPIERVSQEIGMAAYGYLQPFAGACQSVRFAPIPDIGIRMPAFPQNPSA